MRYFIIIIQSILSFFTYLIPKRNNVWIFSSWMGMQYSDNCKYVYEYCNNNEKDLKLIWIFKGEESEFKNVNSYHYKSFWGVFYQLTAGVCFFTHSIASEYNRFLLNRKCKKIQLWHGVPIKKIGFDSRGGGASLYWRLEKLILNENYDLVISTDEWCRNIFAKAFLEDLNKVKVTGFPRNDIFFKKQSNIREKKNIYYMPTFRGKPGDVFELDKTSGFNLEKLNSFLILNECLLYIRLHPVNKLSRELENEIRKFSNVFIKHGGDIYYDLNDCDILISDYSSIVFDFSIKNKPILLFPFDLENYLKEDREMYFDYRSVMKGDSVALNWDDLICKLEVLINSPFIFGDDFFKSFHYYRDGNSSKRVVSEVKGLLK